MTPEVKVVTDYEGSKNTAYSCPSPAGLESCAPALSKSSFVQKYAPGWVLNLTGAAKGKMLIAVGKYLHYFRPDNPGVVYYDGENITTDVPASITTRAGSEDFIENGFLTLARKTKQAKIQDGAIVEEEIFEHGAQQVREVGVGEMMGLTRDCVTGAVRVDVIQPEVVDLVKKGWKSGLRRVGFRTKEITNGCIKVDGKEWFAYNGAMFEESEFAKTSGGVGVAVRAIERKGPNDERVFVLAMSEAGDGAESGFIVPRVAEGEDALTEDSIEAQFEAAGTVRVQWFDGDGDFRTSYKLSDGSWYHPAEKLIQVNDPFFQSLEAVSGTAATEQLQYEIDPTDFGCPADARFVRIYARTYISTEKSAGILSARQAFGDPNGSDAGGDGFNYPYLLSLASNGGASQPDPLYSSTVVDWVPLNSNGVLDAYWEAYLVSGSGVAAFEAAITGWRR